MTQKKETIQKNKPLGLVVAGLSGGSGKSVIAVGLVAAFVQEGRRVVPFKKGPDYIDAGWMHLAAGRPCYNLDPYLMSAETLQASFSCHAQDAEIVVVEGNRGLFDGVDVEGTYSSAELAISLKLPVLLVVDCTKTTRTVAALVLGCRMMDERVDIGGVILNRIAGARHESIVRRSVEHYTGVKVLGAMPKLAEDVFPQRHLGVTPFQEHERAGDALSGLAKRVQENIDLDGVLKIMATPLQVKEKTAVIEVHAEKKVRIGVVRDAAFQFYYPDNLEALEYEGAELIEMNALSEKSLPPLDGLYIGGGFPETSVRELSMNESFRESVRGAADAGLPIYAECGGLIYLGESMELDGDIFPLAGVFPVKFGMEKRPQAHGYTVLEAVNDNSYYARGTEIKGHEFRYSRVLEWEGEAGQLAFHVKRGTGFIDGMDGLIYKNVLALYTHIHAVGTPGWAKALVAAAQAYGERK